MSEYISVNPDRILWCCNKYGISVDLLAKKMHISLPKFTEMLEENDHITITYNQLEKLGETFGESILFFLKSDPIKEDNVLIPQFRTFNSQFPILDLKIKKIIENVVAQHDVYLSLLEDLDIKLTDFKGLNLEGLSIKEKSIKIRNWLGLDNSKKMVFKDYRELIENKNILVFLSAGYNGAWKIPNESPVIGFSFYHEQIPLIFVKKDNEFSDSLSIFTLFHELAHILCHKQTIIDTNEIIYSDKKIEREANLLAANILVSDTMLKLINFNEKPEDVTGYINWVKPIMDKASVSPDVVLLRLMEYDLISHNEYEEFRVYRKEQHEKNKKTYGAESKNIARKRYLEPKQMFGEGYVRVVIDALNNKLVTFNKASNYLDGIKVKNIKEIERSIYG
ncbi:ImmA/IrrE family metallo-endopeptidase [Acinetobacter baumannii]|nr:ImmA/IrrE family metallo-endopeptidase [Acinetobacter baumannii]MDX7907787.1 ImmA/IrrE family metallo-endopeptidase [Acinetobacter baumannii]MDX7927660.1 ImmA/IrrE family metallo-endopeptidase [Acinetobacter baumannii]